MRLEAERTQRTNILAGPPAVRAIANGFAAINSQPALIIFYVFFATLLHMFFALAKEAFAGPIFIGVFIIVALVTVFLKAGVMGSIELILLEKGWIPAAVLECGKLYFGRFFLAILIFLIANFIVSMPIAIMMSLIILTLNSAFSLVGALVLTLLSSLVQAAILLALFLLLSFAFASIVIDNRPVMNAIRRGFLVVVSNKESALKILLILGIVPGVLLICVTRYLIPLDVVANLITGLVASYIDLILMATVLYFIMEIKKQKERSDV